MSFVKDNDWNDFISKIINSTPNKNTISPAFFNHFFWNNIAKKATDSILKLYPTCD
jgi:hypothetical protein